MGEGTVKRTRADREKGRSQSLVETEVGREEVGEYKINPRLNARMQRLSSLRRELLQGRRRTRDRGWGGGVEYVRGR